MVPVKHLITGLVFALGPAAVHAADGGAAITDRPQYVIISFDGAQPIEQWQRSRALARRTGAEFTYFLSCVYLLTRDDRALYDPPGMKRGASNVGFAATRDDVAARLRQIWTARMEGHEIASHGCGHFDGAAWSAAQWGQEHGQFAEIVANAWEINEIPFEPDGWKAFAGREITGFRAPYLATGSGLFTSLEAAGFAYDASGVSRGPVEPEAGAVMRFALPMIPEGPSGRRIIAMDYNLFVRHSGGIEREDTDGAFEQRAYDAFTKAFREQLDGARVPLQVGLHFTLMNGGAYWRALDRFAAEACTTPQVRCVSYSTYLDETQRAPEAAERVDG